MMTVGAGESHSLEYVVFTLQWKRSSNNVLILMSDDMMEYCNWNGAVSASFMSKFVILSLDPNASRVHYKTLIRRVSSLLC